MGAMGPCNCVNAEHNGYDDKGRPCPYGMPSDAMLRALIIGQRALADVLQAVGQNPMMRAMLPAGLI